ncbi:MAG: methyltransferase domain-containing protein [Pseudomonadota bacterium]
MITFQRASKAAIKWASFATLKLRAATGAKAGYSCPACKADVVGFFRYGDNATWGCPACGASPRQRLVCYLLDSGQLTVPKGASVLHIAPNEAGLVSRFAAQAADYVPADLHPDVYDLPGVVAMDLMQMDAKDRFDIIYASHVMEHVEDDARVLSNMFTALKPGGEAWLIVPLWDRPTEDGHMGMSQRERERRFGQWDHVRQYGADFAERIGNGGFVLDTVAARNLAPDLQQKHALDDVIFRARKPA